MLEKIISGGQTGADQGALDAAIKLGIPHGGYIPKGRKTEDGPLPDKYQLIEMSTSSYPERTKKNILESEGTLILSRGKLTGGSALTKDYAKRLNRPCLHINLNTTTLFRASLTVAHWILDNEIKILNVAGPRASKDHTIYEATKGIIESVYHLTLMGKSVPDAIEDIKQPESLPETVDEAVEQLISDIPLKDKAIIANMTETELDGLSPTLGTDIRIGFRLWSENEPLLESCRLVSGQKDLHPDSASQMIIRELWKRLRKTHKLKVVK